MSLHVYAQPDALFVYLPRVLEPFKRGCDKHGWHWELPCAHCHLIFLRVCCKRAAERAQRGKSFSDGKYNHHHFLFIEARLECNTVKYGCCAFWLKNEHEEEGKNVPPHRWFVSRESPRPAALACTLPVLLYIKETKKTFDELYYCPLRLSALIDLRGRRGKNERLKAQLSQRWRTPADPRPSRTHRTRQNRRSVGLTESLTDGWRPNIYNSYEVGSGENKKKEAFF